ncbi:hypothetical protein [Halovenus sp. HT40]|uniref:hypothetical protein n=1 Tax=Halovenus sp. HT40 TaxID=3126691 RepID=UPI00300EC788
MKRRTLLGIAGTVVTSTIAGCLGDNEPDEGSDENTTDAPNNETDAPEDRDERDDGADEQPLFADTFSATTHGGFLAIDEDTDSRSEARDAGFVLPEGAEVSTLEATVADDGSWESTKAEFPTVRIDDPITTDVSLELPDGLTGRVSEERMTASGKIRVVIEELDTQFSFDIEATSEQSGTLEGETNFEEEPLTATLVDNEFTIEDSTGNFLVDGQLGLPADEAGTNWFEIELELTGA